MKRNWEYKNIEECLEKVTVVSKLQTKDFLSKGKFPIVSQEVDYISGYWNNDSDVVRLLHPVVVFGDHSRVVKYIDFDFVVGADGVKILSPKDFLNPKFLYYFVKSADIPSLGYSRHYKLLREKDVPVPPLEEQSRIVAELDLLTGIIDKQNAQLKELDNLAQAIFYDMFGDPIENPEGWDVKKLGDVSTSVSYGTSSPSSTVGKYKYLRMNNITYEGFLDLTDLKYIDMDDAEFEKYSVREGDVLFNRTNSMDLIGKTTYIHNMEPMIIAGYIIRVRLVDSVLPVYVSKFMNMPAMKKKLKGMAKGAVNQANINSKELKSIDIPLPPLALQQSFAEKIQSIEKQKETIRASIADTQKLLDYTMDKYFG